MSRRHGPVLPLPREYWVLLTGRTFLNLTDGVAPLFLTLTAISSGVGAGTLGPVLAAVAVASAVSALPAGALADRFSRRAVLITGDLLLIAAMLVVAVSHLDGSPSMGVIVGALLVRSVVATAAAPAISGLIASTVTAEARPRANGQLSVSFNLVQVVGPLAGSAAFAFLPGVLTAVLLAAFPLLSLACLLLLPREPEREPEVGSTIWSDLHEVWSEIRARSWYLPSIASHALVGFGMSAVFLLGPILLLEAGDVGGVQWGIAVACGSVGAIAGGLWVSTRQIPRRPLAVVNGLVGLAALQAIALATGAPVWVIGAAFLLGTMSMVLLNEVWNTVVQNLLPEDMVSRASSVDWAMSLAFAPLGYLCAGTAAESIGAAPTLWIAAAVVVSGAVFGALWPGVLALRSHRAHAQ